MNFDRQYIGVVILLCTAAPPQLAAQLSQYVPLSVTRQSAFGQNPVELQVRNVLSKLPYFGVFDHIQYRVYGNLVTLSGEVLHADLRHDSEKAVKKIDGVRHVKNGIRLLADSPAENETRKAVFVAIYADPILHPYTLVSGGAIHIVVEGNRVRLEGEVSSDTDRRWAATRAGSAPGVVVVNHLTVCH